MILHSGGQKLDQVSEQEEIDKNLKLLVTNIPEKIRQEVLDRLMVALGLKELSDFPYLKSNAIRTLANGMKKGQRWNKVTCFYTVFSAPNKQ